MTTYNNPAFLAFQMATAAPYAVNWATGVDKLLVVSVGTGGAAKAQLDLKAASMNILYNASTLPGALMNAAAAVSYTHLDVYKRQPRRCPISYSTCWGSRLAGWPG